MSERLFTKSLYNLARECPTKLFYTKKPEIYGDLSQDDPFMEALAEGGFQVGALAQIYHPGGHHVKTKNSQEALKLTNELLKQENVVIFEAAILYNNLFVRVDVLKKEGNKIDLIEVKSKSFDPIYEWDKNPFYDKRKIKRKNSPVKKIIGDYKKYLFDVAFQYYVLSKSHPHWQITPYLMMVDKTKVATIEGLGLKFFVNKESRFDINVEIKPPNLKKEDLGQEILCKVDVLEQVNLIIEGKDGGDDPRDGIQGMSFEEEILYLADMYKKNKKIPPILGGIKCRDCQFKIPIDMRDQGLQSGFFECWNEKAGLEEKDCDGPFFFDVWYNPINEMVIEEKRFLIKDLKSSDINHESSRGPRQWIQIEKVKNSDTTPFIDKEGLKLEMETWSAPFHFIDFETMMLAIPQHIGRKPFEQTAFQFSHHKISEDGLLEHSSEYIETTRAKFPNFDFIRNLKKELDQDNGTIFRWAAHENSVLNQIWTQLQDSKEKDKDELCEFIEHISKSSRNTPKNWEGNRNMIDLLDITIKYYYHPKTGGKNGLKYVLPATLQESKYLQEKWSKPEYNSNNFKDFAWINFDENGIVIDPYKKLDPVFKDASDIEIERFGVLLNDQKIADGGAAMMAFSKMQFCHVENEERECIITGLKKYCELDTLAMVMIWEYFNNLTS